MTIHLNIADYAAAVERMDDAGLRICPVIAAPRGAARAVVHDMREEAYQSDVRKGMPLMRAPRRCKEAVDFEFGADANNVFLVNSVLYQLCERIGAELWRRLWSAAGSALFFAPRSNGGAPLNSTARWMRILGRSR